MPRFALIITLLGCLAATGCAPTASERLAGKWEYHLLDRGKQGSEAPGGTAGVKETLLGMAAAAGMEMRMEIEFKDDQTVLMSASLFGTKTSGPMQWKVVKADGETATVEIRRPDNEKPVSLQITFVDEDQIRVARPGAGRKSFVFARVKQE